MYILEEIVEIPIPVSILHIDIGFTVICSAEKRSYPTADSSALLGRWASDVNCLNSNGHHLLG